MAYAGERIPGASLDDELMPFTPRLIAVAGTPGSGKDELVRAVNDLGVGHAEVVPKHTSRRRRADDGAEMICKGDDGWALDDCDVQYENFGTRYGVDAERIWEGIARGVFQVLVVSNTGALNDLRNRFGGLVLCVYVHSEMREEEFRAHASGGSTSVASDSYVERRVQEYWAAFDVYVANMALFDHVFIHAGPPEDLFDQIFRLFSAYETEGLR